MLLTHLLPCPAARDQSRVHDVEELLDIWHGLQQCSWRRARLHACVRAKGGHEFWQYAKWV